MQRVSVVLGGLGAFLALGPGVPAARAIVTTIGAAVSAEVRQTIGGSTVNSDSAFDQLDLTTFRLPLLAEARLFLDHTAAAAAPASQDLSAGAANAHFRDPRLGQEETPNEFALDAVGFSDTADSTVIGQAASTERREVTFTAAEAGFDTGTAVEAESRFFLDGILILLAKPGLTDLSGARTEMSIRVSQQRGGPNAVTVLEAAVILTGNADGTATLTVNGALVPDNVTTFGLAPGGLIEGGFQAVLLPQLAIPYVYPATIDETFSLTAEITTRFEAPPGTGAVGILGDGINNLVALIEAALGENLADEFADGLSLGLFSAALPTARLIADSTATTLKVVTPPRVSLLPNCGLLGAESALMAMGLLGVIGLRSRRHA